MVVQRIVGFVAFFVLLFMAMGDLTIFVDVPSLCLVVVGTLGMLFLGGSRLPLMFRAVFSGAVTTAELRAGLSGWKRARTYSLVAGIICVLIGLVTVLINLDNPSAIGPGMALAILGTLYAMVLGFGVCLPLQARLEDCAEVAGEDGLTTTAALATVFTFVLILGLLATLLAIFPRAGS